MKLTLAYINDVHGYIKPHKELFYNGTVEKVDTAGGYARISELIKQIRNNNPDTLLFDGGDTFHGTLPVVESKGECLIPILNQLGFTAMVGHWDFGYGPAQLKKIISRLNYPFLGINVYRKNGTLFSIPFILKNIGNIKIGIIGICSNIIDKTMPESFSRGLKITDGSKELPVYKKTKKSGR